jgi:hypothetical protein
MWVPLQTLGVVILLTSAGPAWATRAVLISSDVPSQVVLEQKAKGSSPGESEESRKRQEEDRRERLLRELRELYKPAQPEN